MKSLRWIASMMLVLVVFTSCAKDEEATTSSGAVEQANNPLVGTWQIYNDPTTDAHWIFDPTYILYQEQADGLYLKHSYGLTGSQIVIRSGPYEGSYGFTHDENQLTLVDAETSQTTFFTRVSDSTTPPGASPP